MSTFEFKLPDIGEGVMEGEIVKWLVQPGDLVREDQPMVEVMTDKATVTITSPKGGKVLEVAGGEGAVVAVHEKLVLLDLGGGGPEAAPEPAPPAAPARPTDEGPAATAVGDIREDLPGMAPPQPTVDGESKASQAAPLAEGRRAEDHAGDRPLATPATRKLARDLGVDLRHVPPSGSHGRVTSEDVQRFARAPSQAPPAAREPAPRSATGDETRTPLRGVRKRIFDAMARSKHTAAHFTFVEECDVGRLKELRGRLLPQAAAEGVRLTYLPFFIKAAVAALKRYPALNSAYDPERGEIVTHHRFHIGVASATDSGLMVPVIHDAGDKSLLGLAREVERLAEATKSGRVAPDDLRGSTFTITSLGAQGGLLATPILNSPEVGILGIHRMKQKPIVRDGAIVVGDVMLLSLSFDHRLIDGHVGAAFAYEIIRYLESPELFLL